VLEAAVDDTSVLEATVDDTSVEEAGVLEAAVDEAAVDDTSVVDAGVVDATVVEGQAASTRILALSKAMYAYGEDPVLVHESRKVTSVLSSVGVHVAWKVFHSVFWVEV
jgi:hypothetical protein